MMMVKQKLVSPGLQSEVGTVDSLLKVYMALDPILVHMFFSKEKLVANFHY